MSATVERQLPTGTVTFLFTDIEGSTRLLTALGERYAQVLQRHGDILRHAIGAHGGSDVSTEGDSFFAVFRSAVDGVRAAADAQLALASEVWPEDAAVRVRMGLHTGEGRLGGDNYVGMDVHRGARIAAAGAGGQVLVSDATQALVRRELPEGVELRDLAEHRLKDLPAPERLWQLQIPGLEQEFPTLRTPDARPNNLPVSATPLIGREAELDQVLRLLRERRLVTLTGPGGTGKTRLALAAAARLLPDHADGVFFIPLEEAVDRPAVTAAAAAALDLRAPPDQDLERSFAESVRDRELLLVLDNFEQAMSAAPLVGELLAAAPRLRVLVTSRAALHVAGEQEFHVPPLALPDPTNLPDLDALSQYEAVALFIARARAVRPGFEVNNQNAPAVAEICSRLDGLPLAIELAAAGIKLLSPQAILERLERHLPIPGAGPTDVPERQRTLQAAIDWSYDLLTEPERRLFEQLAVFAGGWTLEAAESICDPMGELGAEILDGLASLTDASLIFPVDDDEAEPRFAMLQVIRDGGAARLAAGPDAKGVERRHAEYFLLLAELAEPHLIRTDVRDWQRRLRRDQDNLRAAMRWAVEEQAAEIGQRMAGSLWRYWHYWGELREARNWLESVLALPNPVGAEAGVARANALVGVAGVVYWQGEVDAAEGYYQEALALYESAGDLKGSADVLHAMAFTGIARDDIALATERIERAIEQYRLAGDEVNASLAAIHGRNVMFFAGRGMSPEEGLALAQEMLEIARDAGLALEEADALGSLSQIYEMAGDHHRALDAFRETARIWYQIGNIGMLPWLKTAASMELGLGRPERAVTMVAIADRAIDQLGGQLHPALMGAGDPLGEARKLLPEDIVAPAYEAGRAMSFDEAVAFVLEEPDDGDPDSA